MADAEIDTNNIIAVKRRAIGASAVQFTGKNGAEVVAFVKDIGQEDARNGGSYVTVTTDAYSAKATKGDWVVVDADGTILVLTPPNFAKLFSIKG